MCELFDWKIAVKIKNKEITNTAIGTCFYDIIYTYCILLFLQTFVVVYFEKDEYDIIYGNIFYDLYLKYTSRLHIIMKHAMSFRLGF